MARALTLPELIRLASWADEALDLARSYTPADRLVGRYSGVELILHSFPSGIEYGPTLVGFLPDEVIPEKLGYVGEKRGRLLASGLVSTYADRDPEQKKFGGAIRTGLLGVIASGQPETTDETFDLILAFWAGQATRADAAEICLISGNDVFPLIPRKFLRRRF